MFTNVCISFQCTLIRIQVNVRVLASWVIFSCTPLPRCPETSEKCSTRRHVTKMFQHTVSRFIVYLYLMAFCLCHYAVIVRILLLQEHLVQDGSEWWWKKVIAIDFNTLLQEMDKTPANEESLFITLTTHWEREKNNTDTNNTSKQEKHSLNAASCSQCNKWKVNYYFAGRL